MLKHDSAFPNSKSRPWHSKEAPNHTMCSDPMYRQTPKENEGMLL